MTQLDVTQLTKEGLSSGTFPACMAADFRLFFQPAVHAEILSHAAEDTSFEICGILVGCWESDGNGPYAVVSNRIRCDNASSKLAEVTFTHESWAQINEEMDTKYSDLRIIGWYHSHPDFGIFLSDRDVFIQENFFSGAGQVAFVVDPVRKTEGVFEWRDRKPELMSQYWVGNLIVPKAASAAGDVAAGRPAREMSVAGSPAAVSEGDSQRPIRNESSLSVITTVLCWCCLFLFGYLLAGQRSQWEQTMLREGTVAHYGLWNLLKPGWETELQAARTDLNSIVGDLKTLSDEHVRLSEGDKKTLRSKWLSIRKKVASSQKTLSHVEAQYGLSNEEKQVIAMIISQRVTELSGVIDPALSSVEPHLPAPVLRPDGGKSSSSSSGKSSTKSTGQDARSSKSLTPEAGESSPRTSDITGGQPKPVGPKPLGSTNSN
jgi:proteasome lid subunit RPN8/RPN11